MFNRVVSHALASIKLTVEFIAFAGSWVTPGNEDSCPQFVTPPDLTNASADKDQKIHDLTEEVNRLQALADENERKTHKIGNLFISKRILRCSSVFYHLHICHYNLLSYRSSDERTGLAKRAAKYARTR